MHPPKECSLKMGQKGAVKNVPFKRIFNGNGTKRGRKGNKKGMKRERKDCVKTAPSKRMLNENGTKILRKNCTFQKNIQRKGNEKGRKGNEKGMKREQKDCVKTAPSPARLQFFTALNQGLCTERKR